MATNKNFTISGGTAMNIVRDKIADSMTNTVVLEAILGIAIVAFILTIIELSSIIYIVFPKIKEQITKMLQSKYSESMKPLKPLKPLIRTLATRETVFTERANNYIQLVAWGFAFILALLCFILGFLINNEYRLQRKLGSSGEFYKIVFWSFVTIIGIGIFQGFGCIALGQDSFLCSMNSFAVVSAEWKKNDNFSHMALSTGICDGVADTESVSTDQNFDTVLALHIAQQIATQASDPDTATREILKEIATSDESYQILNEAPQRLRRSSGVQERT
jgi:tetrahydromethanopterin S-methyltransferase subunit B